MKVNLFSNDNKNKTNNCSELKRHSCFTQKIVLTVTEKLTLLVLQLKEFSIMKKAINLRNSIYTLIRSLNLKFIARKQIKYIR